MSTSIKSVQTSEAARESRRAIDHLFDEYDRCRTEKELAEKRLARFADSIQIMIRMLPKAEQDEYGRRFSVVKTGTLARGGEVFGNVISIFRRAPQTPLSVAQVQQVLESDGKEELDTKSVANAIAYLARSGRLRRVARGQYVITNVGAGIEMEGYDDGTVRSSEHFA